MNGTRTRTAFAAGWITIVAGLLGSAYWVAGSLNEISAKVDRLTEQVAATREKIQLMRVEQEAEAGTGYAALVDRLRYWAPQPELATTAQAQLPQINEKLEAILDAFAALGPEAFDQLVETFRTCQRGTDDALHKWLLRAMDRVDPARAKSVMQEVLLGLEFWVSPRLRLFAADLLNERDAQLAAEGLRTVLMRENFQGIELDRLDPALRERYPDAQERIGTYKGFWTFVQKYAAYASANEDVEQILLMILGRRGRHDLLTIQECVKALGSLKAQNAAEPIKELFENPPRNHHPMFRNHCLDAIANILGPAACPYFQSALRREEHQMIQIKLTELVKQNCG